MPTHGGDGGPAFPMATFYAGKEIPGMSLRDWFAGQALAGASAAVSNSVDAGWCYRQADAMLAEREKTR